MKILTTGGCGFIGSNFIIEQIQKGNKIYNIDNLTYAGNQSNLNKIIDNPNYFFSKVDICDKELVSNIIFDFKPDCLVNFAAESHVDRSIDSPIVFVKTNVLGTANLLECSRKYYNSSKKGFLFIHISTDEVYGSLGEKGYFTEMTNYSPSSPYSASKASSDHLARSWFKTYNLPTIITNCSNNYGPYQFPEKLIPLIIANCIDEKPLPIYGKGLNVRDWLYVEDHCDAIFKIIKKGRPGETYNIGGNNEIKNIDIVKLVCSIMDKLKPLKSSKKYSDLIKFVKDRPGHDLRYAIDAKKLHKEIGWSPKENFKSGVLKTVRWYLENESWWRKIQTNKYNQERLGLNIK